MLKISAIKLVSLSESIKFSIHILGHTSYVLNGSNLSPVLGDINGAKALKTHFTMGRKYFIAHFSCASKVMENSVLFDGVLHRFATNIAFNKPNDSRYF